jgi:transcriptional regulator with XRE-family HTH domain
MRNDCCIPKKTINDLRIERGLNFNQLHELTGISLNTLWKLESYPFQFSTCDTQKLAYVFGVKMEDLVKELDQEFKYKVKEFFDSNNPTIVRE